MTKKNKIKGAISVSSLIVTGRTLKCLLQKGNANDLGVNPKINIINLNIAPASATSFTIYLFKIKNPST